MNFVINRRVNNYCDSTAFDPTITYVGSSVASQRTNVALATNGATAIAQNYTQDGVYPGLLFRPSFAIDGIHYINPPNGDRYWRDEHGLPTSLEIDFNDSKTIDEIDVYTTADYPAYFSEPLASSTFTSYGITSFDVQYWNGSAFATVPGGSIRSNNLVWKPIRFSAVTTSKIRIIVNAAVDGVARVVQPPLE